ncbi:ESX-2 secretion system protein eccB2 [Mycobacteroides abscessus subsp. abscessus]|uniref:type VII secretion protein EccB n=1 Tax=Mycobacteroides abscessus TaxID=36809 RepID=UPI0009A619CC|nr:type VII secretion protein EccB [Mycobacteroides abscessus]SKO34977.1 ESX-2 secretion system protein eccB2 [Mycobacteroides abscessus subsp. abscessus]
MPLQRSNGEQLSAYSFNLRRLAAAVSRFSVRMIHDDRKARAALLAAVSIFIVIELLMMVIRIFKPAGLAGEEAPIIGNRDTGAVYARIDGVLHPAFFLTSARLATGTAGNPKWVTGAEIAKFPQGPWVGIPGAPPSDMNVNDAPVSAFAACDTAASARAGAGDASVTAIAGQLSRSERSDILADGRAVLVSHGGANYIVWGGKRTKIDIGNRVITVNLGLDPGVTAPMPISKALFDALPSTEPLVVPEVPNAGSPSQYPSLSGALIGSVVDVRDAAGGQHRFYIVLPNGVQQVTDFTANLMRTANSYGEATTRTMTPDKLVDVPQVDALNVAFYPRQRMTFVDTTANPVLCVSWEKARTDRQATITVYSGRTLPISESIRPVKLVRDDRGPESTEATQAVVLPGAANFLATTSEVVTSETRESLWWLSPQGVRFGVSNDASTLRALGFGDSKDAKDIVKTAMAQAQQAPWPLLRMFGQGPALSTERALKLRDTVGEGNGQVALATKPGA